MPHAQSTPDFMLFLLALPLSGWIYVSTGWSAPNDQPLEVATSFFGLFPILHLPFVAAAPEDARRVVAFGILGVHEFLAWGMVALVLLHVGAALKHQFVDRDAVLASIIPWLKPGTEEKAERRGRSIAALLAGLLLVIALWFAGWAMHQPATSRAVAAEAAPAKAAAAVDTSITPGTASEWVIDPAASSIEFSGNHAGKDFVGRFGDWEGHVWFDPEDLGGSRAIVLVRTGSARTGDATQEGSLALDEWFDVENYPVARFDAATFRSLGGDRFEAVGTLTIKHTSLPVVLPFTYSSGGDGAKVEGVLELDRTALDLGMASDPTADWVSKMVGVKVSVAARRK